MIDAKMNWRNLPAYLLMLSKFRNSFHPHDYCEGEHWERVLNEKPSKVIELFINEGMLRRAELHELMDYKFTITMLKNILKGRNLKTSGIKAELIKRLIEFDKQAMLNITNDIDLYCCTDAGKQITLNYLEQEERKRQVTEDIIFEHLSKKEFKEAVNVVANYESIQVFPRGLGIDWNNYNVESDVNLLEIIFSRIPKILEGINVDKLNEIRKISAIKLLWGTSNTRRWIVDDFDTGTHFTAGTCAQMILKHAYFVNELNSYQARHVKTVRIIGADDASTCPECKKIHEIKYNLNELPELPYPKCSCEFGCRCTVIVDTFDGNYDGITYSLEGFIKWLKLKGYSDIDIKKMIMEYQKKIT